MSSELVESEFTENAKCIVEHLNCQFYVKHKKRFCKLAKIRGPYCTEHSYLLDDSNSVRKRIICPLDSKHSIFEDELHKHVKKCNNRSGLRPRCYKEDINSGDNEGSDPCTYEVTLRSAEEHEALEMITMCQQLYTEHIGKIRKEILFHDVMKEEYESSKNGPSAHKHILQQASLIGHMHRLGFLDDRHCYIEFGCGKGGLSHWVQQSVKDKTDTQFILVDKSSVRYKMDSYHKGADQGPNFERIKIDIQHLDIRDVPNLDNGRQIVTIGKHLCGAATDLMLRCLTRLEPHVEHKRAVRGVVLALCCHHRCHWKSYVGKTFIQQVCGLTARQFHILCSMSSWATCSSKPVDSKKVQDGATYRNPRAGNLLPQEREVIGNQCKQLIDMGRIKYLEDRAFKGELVEFIDKEYTLENVCILAHKILGF